MMYEAILFDMDGVITDTQQAVIAFWQVLAAQHGVTLTQADFDTHIFGCQTPHTLDVLFPHLGPDERAAVLAEEEESEASAAYIAMPGALELLRALKDQGIPTALVTSGQRWKAGAVVSQLGLDDLLTVQVTAEDIQHSKPHPDGYLLAARSLNTPPAQCIVFEDAPSGVQAAVAAGALCIGVRPAQAAAPLMDAGASHVIPDLSAVRLADGTLWLGDQVALPLNSNC